MPDRHGDLCRARLVDAGFADRTDLVLAREAGLWQRHREQVLRATSAPPSAGLSTGGLSTGGEPVPAAPTITTATGSESDAGGDDAVTFEQLDSLLAAADPVDAVAAAFIAGRCETDDDDDRLRGRLRTICADYDVTTAGERSLLVTESAMSLALLGDVDRATAVLGPMVELDGPRSTTDWLAAYYLAQLGDVAGYPLIVRLLDHDLGHYRVLAARQLAGFCPHDGERVGELTIDVVGRLTDLLDDKDPDVGSEIPGLIAEAAGDRARPILERAAKKAKRRETKQAATWVLGRLADRAAPE